MPDRSRSDGTFHDMLLVQRPPDSSCATHLSAGGGVRLTRRLIGKRGLGVGVPRLHMGPAESRSQTPSSVLCGADAEGSAFNTRTACEGAEEDSDGCWPA